MRVFETVHKPDCTYRACIAQCVSVTGIWLHNVCMRDSFLDQCGGSREGGGDLGTGKHILILDTALLLE